MSKSNSKVEVTEEWQYEAPNTNEPDYSQGYNEYGHVPPEPFEPTLWIPEDDERSASWKAKKPNNTGRVRSRTVTTTTTKEKLTNKNVKTLVESVETEWVYKNQSLV